MLADLWAYYDIIVGFIDTVITKWMGQENPFADFNSKMIDIEKLTKEMGRSISGRDEEIKSIQQAALTYEAVRAENKADGMVFVPTWMILYQDTSAVRPGYSCYALINAVDGTLIDASFR